MKYCMTLLWLLAFACQAANAPPTTHPWLADDWQRVTPHPSAKPALIIDTLCPRYCTSIYKYSHRYHVPARLVMALIQAESAFNKNAISPVGAKGLMQLMDVNWKPWRIDPFNADQNIQVGTALLARLLKKYRNVRLALAAYNAGEGAVKHYGGVPPYRETQTYIRRIDTLLRDRGDK